MLEDLMELQTEDKYVKSVFREAVKSYCIAGLGVIWVRYEPTISTDPTGKTEVSRERVKFDLVNYDDYLFPDVRPGTDLPWKARRIFLTGEDVKERFKVSGEQLDAMSFKTGNRDGETLGVMNLMGKDDLQTTAIWEVWCKREGAVYFFSGDEFNVLLKPKQPLNPVRFVDFYPCPDPMVATTGTESLWPVPNHVYTNTSEETIQDSRKTQRALIKKAIPKALINGEFGEELKKLWSSNEPVAQVLDNWVQFVNKSGFEGNIAYSPVQAYIESAQTMSQQIQEELTGYWELCGITDLMRGIADPQNAAATNQLLSDYGDTRTQGEIDIVTDFFSDLYGKMADVICDVFSEDTILRDSGALMDDQVAQKAALFLKQEWQRAFRIAIETGTTLNSKNKTNVVKATEMLSTIGQVLTLALQTAEKAPSYAQAMHALIMHTVRSMSEGRKIEEELEQAFLQGLEQAKQGQEQAMQAQQAQQQQEQQMAQMQQQLQQFQMQIQSRETGVNEFEAQIKQFIAQSNAQIEQLKLQIEQATAGQKAQTDMALAQHQAQMTAQKTQAEVAKAQAEMVSAQQRVEMEAAKAGRELDIKEGQAIADTHLKKQELDDQRAVNLGELLTTGEVR
jgi:hypothetical protein